MDDAEGRVAVTTKGEGVCREECQKSSLSRGGDFFGNHRSAMKERSSGFWMVSANTFCLRSVNCSSTAVGGLGAHSLGACQLVHHKRISEYCQSRLGQLKQHWV